MRIDLNLASNFEKRCVVVGTTRLCLTVLDKLLERSWDILSVVSEDEVVREYCFLKNLSCHSSLTQIDQKRFVLFSVANYSLVSMDFLNKHDVVLAINYHDSNLPKYAGVNSTTWAIYNNETVHGVTWHCIVSGIDEGDILKQSAVPIEDSETALSLNLKCFEEAVRTFESLLQDFESGILKAAPQDLSNKSYYGMDRIPKNYGIIDFNDPYEEIDRLSRSLNFGENGFDNSVCSLKLWDGKRCYLAGPLYFSKQEGTVPGEVYPPRSNGCLDIGIKGGVLTVQSLYCCDRKALLEVGESGFKVGAVVPSFHLALQEQETLSKIKKSESKVVKIFKSEECQATSFFPKALIKNAPCLYQRIHTFPCMNLQEALTKIALVLLKFTSQELCVPIVSAPSCGSSFLQEFVREKSFLFLQPSQQKLDYPTFADLIRKQADKKLLFAKDIFSRYQLESLQHDIGIFIDREGFFEAPHRLKIFISSSEVEIRGDMQDETLLNSLSASIYYILGCKEETFASLLFTHSVIPPKDFEEIFVEWNRSDKDYPENKTIHALFEEQVASTPDEIAVVCNSEKLTFKELNEKANKLARQLRDRAPIAPGTPIPLCTDRSIEMVIGILGIMKAGGAYVPIEPGYPMDRVNYIFKDTGSCLFLTQPGLVAQDALDEKIETIFIGEAVLKEGCSDNLPSSSGPQDLAYLIYTSGTTGNPKGVMIEHHAVLNVLWSLEDVYDLAPSHKKTSCFTSFIFDVSVTEIFTSLLKGGELHLFDNDHKFSPELLAGYILEKEINYLYLPPAILGLLPKKEYPSLRAIIFAGEPCDQSVGAYWATHYALYNYYGPTECTVYATGKRVHVRNVNEIGKPVHNKKAYVLDAYMNPVPVGVVGELYIGGVGQARGYLNLPQLTSERFLPNPLQTPSEKAAGKNNRIYKTGDVVRWLPDGNIEYIGRNDFQIKIRGFRVELGEIERTLSAHPKIKQSVVLVKEYADEKGSSSAHKSLVAFCVAEGALDETQVLAYLQTKLPDYMVPSALIQLDRFPTTLTGKLDRSKLLSMEIRSSKKKAVPPSSQIEKEVFAYWSEVLKIAHISMDDGFFQLGGNSLLAMVLQAKLSAHFGLDLSLLTLFQYPTIKSLSAFISDRLKGDGRTKEIVSEKTGNATPSRDIAIIGMACRAPGADNIREFWKNLASGTESIEDVAPCLTEEARFVSRAGNVARYFGFDATFFGYTPKEAASIDPQHRHFMEVVFEALEDSGYDPASTDDPIGLYAGQGDNTYFLQQIWKNQELEEDLGGFQLKINNDKDFLTTKASYKLNLRGPSLDIQTACSTSLVAVHVAISQLLEGDCKIAVAGGVSLEQRNGYTFKKGMIESPDGKCRAFDDEAQGTVITSGVGAIVLKPLAKAIQDGDHIYAVIKGTAINNDGGGASKAGYTAPSVQGQVQVIKRALSKACVEASTISYIEAHGTGTKIGDPIELAALHQVFSESCLRESSIAIGSVKTNIGHTDAAAGIMGLIKTALALEHKKIPATLHFQSWNKEIGKFNTIFYVNKTCIDWQAGHDAPRRAGVSSFGIGGTNAHVVLEEAPMAPKSRSSRPYQLCLVSASSETSLLGLIKKLEKYLHEQENIDLASMAYTQQIGRKSWLYRSFFVCSGTLDLAEQLKAFTESQVLHESPLEVVFLFSGQGSQYANMAAELYLSEPVFAQEIDKCCHILKQQLNIDLLKVVFHEEGGELKETKYAQLALFVFEYALSTFYMSLGVRPSALIGHSIGEYVAATVAGVFELEDALRLVALRGSLMQSAKRGAMLSVCLASDILASILPDSLDIAAVNGPDLCVVSGDIWAIDRFAATLAEEKIAHTRLHTSHAFHSRMMEDVLEEYRNAVSKVLKKEPSIPLISNITGSWLSPIQAKSSEYWTNHIRKTVQFYPGIKTALGHYNRPFFIEIGPGNVLTTLVKQASKEAKAVASLRHPKTAEPDCKQFLYALGSLWKEGYAIDWHAFHKYETLQRVSLPTYCFDHKDYGPTLDPKAPIQVPAVLESKRENELACKMKEIWKSVLGLDVIQFGDNFFELGGHSLLATQVIRQTELLLGMEIEVKDLFQYPTLRDLCAYLERKKACAELTAQQEGLFVLQNINGKDFSAYNEPLLFKVQGKFSKESLHEAFRTLVKRHEILRTVFVRGQNDETCQSILPSLEPCFEFFVCTDAEAQMKIRQEMQRGFNWEDGPLFRVVVVSLGNSEHLVLIVFHHVITDGSSLNIFCKELSEAYNAASENRLPDLPPIAKQYRDYASWQKKFFTSESYREKITFWKTKLAGYQELNLTQNKRRSSLYNYQGDKCFFHYGQDLSQKLKSLAKKEKTTLFNILLAGFTILLSRYCRQTDVLVGAPMSNRLHKDFQDVLGLFTNTVVLRNTIDPKRSFKELLRLVQDNTLSAYENQELPFDHLVSHLSIERDASRNPLVQVFFILVNKSQQAELKLKEATAQFVHPPVHPTAKVDLSLAFFEEDTELNGYFEYCTEVFDKETMQLLSKYLEDLFKRVVEDPDRPLATISILDDDEELALLKEWNPKIETRPVTCSLHEAFKETAAKFPGKVAIKMGTKTLTYAELDEMSDKLSWYLLAKFNEHYGKESLPPNTLIAICVEPSLDTLVSILAVLKTGAAYVPIDPNYPLGRIEHILEDSKPPLVIVQKQLLHKIVSFPMVDPKTVILIDELEVQNEISNLGPRAQTPRVSPQDLAYVIYTSGSTGRPKGVLIPHENVLHLFYAASRHYTFGSADVWALFHSFGFDVSVWEIWGTFLYGGTLVVVPYEVTRNSEAFYELSKKEKLTVLNQTPSAFRNYIDADVAAKEKISTLRFVIFAGEALDIETLRDWWRSHDDTSPQLVNMYGITETTIHATYQEIFFSDLAEGKHGRIGVPLDHLRAYVLDEQGNLCPVGVMGELYVGGGGVARGYFNREDLTRDRFILNPFANKAGLDPSDRLYKSGDLVRWKPDGNLEYIGRSDFQVKLRGFRIELGEIEAVINKYSLVKQSIVIVREEEGQKYLACYFTTHSDEGVFDLVDFDSYLRGLLPDYMIPSAYMRMERMPLTVNGKIDRGTLPKPDFAVMSGPYIPLENELERAIAGIWAEILKLEPEKISAHANYFQLGGNSISIVRMIGKVRALTGAQLPFSTFWKAPTVRTLAAMIQGKGATDNGYTDKIRQLILDDLVLSDEIQSSQPPIDSPKKALLTGATGFLGTHLLQELCKVEGMEVYCLVRGKNPAEAKSRLHESLSKNEMGHLISSSAIHVICGDLTMPRLGLAEEEYAALADTLDVIYHNGAVVHHLYDYEYMRAANVLSTHEILKLAVTGRSKGVHFVSTISVLEIDVAAKLKSPGANWTFLELNGYLLTKWVSEQLVLQAADRGIRAHIYRPGNITGHSLSGHCVPEQNHTLLKLKGFIQLGQAYFDETEEFEMTPVDILAKDIVRKSLSPLDQVIFNMDNPSKIPFMSYVEAYVQRSYPIKRESSLSDWQRALSSITEENALYPLRGFYDNYGENKIERAISHLMGDMPAYQDMIHKQIEFLEKRGFVPKKGGTHVRGD